MRSSYYVRGAAVAAAAAMVALSAAPATAATVAQASATALSLELAGAGGTDSGTYAVTNDGKTTSESGTNEPVITALGGNNAIHEGTLAQDAVAGADGTSAACSGLAGDGATLVAVGNGDCLNGGDAVTLDAASLDFGDVNLISSPLFQGIDTQLQDQLRPYQRQISDAVSDALGNIVPADSGIHLDLGAVQSHCQATTSKATGDSTLADSSAYAELPGVGRIPLVSLPVHPSVNQHVVSDLSGVTDAVLKALRSQLTTGLNGALSPISSVLDQVQDQLLDNIIGQVSAQLKPLEDNVLDITLNKQTKGPGSITVTALDASVLPAAKQFVGADLAHITIGTSKCGPNSPAPRAVPAVNTPPKAAPPADVPTSVPAGLASYDDGQAGRTALVTLLLLAAAGTGVGAYVRMMRRG